MELGLQFIIKAISAMIYEKKTVQRTNITQ